MKKIKRGRPRRPPTQVIRVPVDKIKTVEDLLGCKLVGKQTPHVMIRVPVSEVKRIRKVLSHV